MPSNPRHPGIGQRQTRPKCLPGDKTGLSIIALWESHIGALIPGKSYHLQNVLVKQFGDEYSLATPRHGMTIKEIADLPGVASTTHTTASKHIHNAKVVAVSTLTKQHSCIVCKKGHTTPLPDNPSIGRCSNCPTVTLLTKCTMETSAMLTIESGDL